ncbi:hemerythrin domain-containing protein [Pontibacter anaerobius]|uniref:Hemerythrin domain-containing protein n=1 Tax=Pontibacter anaerobius TaxID=2993940 RepID=A0ABT3RC49_9BACT|nr:hemerythrin domain-containing protein [Pontibacter anaerobius]MCX2739427.1 hemerythrin domain-containing protein [Pontibacter anaerobius]
MKRHESLIPISRQHHGGLLTARLLQHGAPAYKGMPTTPAAKRDYVLAFLQEHLLPHFKLEEETVFILASDFSEELQQQAAALQAEHRKLEQLILALPAVDAANLPDRLDKVGKLLEQHIRQEERVFFEIVQQKLPGEKLRLLQQQVLRHLGE